MTRTLVPYLSGLVFALGLGISGMTSPPKILAFLSFFGAWDPSMLWVMGVAVAVFALGYRLALRRGSPLIGGRFQVPAKTRVETKLVVGALLFGAGWGLAGYCPGPAIVALASGASGPRVFVLSMVVGMLAADILQERLARSGPRPPTVGSTTAT